MLRAAAVDAREDAGKRALLEAGGRKEIGMITPSHLGLRMPRRLLRNIPNYDDRQANGYLVLDLELR